MNREQFESLLKLYEDIAEMKKFTKADHGPLLSMANSSFHYINGYFPDITKWTLHK